jgi:hypothetical protein
MNNDPILPLRPFSETKASLLGDDSDLDATAAPPLFAEARLLSSTTKRLDAAGGCGPH